MRSRISSDLKTAMKAGDKEKVAVLRLINAAIQSAEIEAKGKTLDVEGCIDATLEWRQKCAANKVMCDNAIPLAMYHCLEQQDRQEQCMIIDEDMAKGTWLMEHCRERGSECKVMKKCPCAAAYRALDSFCRSGQESVQVEL